MTYEWRAEARKRDAAHVYASEDGEHLPVPLCGDGPERERTEPARRMNRECSSCGEILDGYRPPSREFAAVRLALAELSR